MLVTAVSRYLFYAASPRCHARRGIGQRCAIFGCARLGYSGAGVFARRTMESSGVGLLGCKASVLLYFPERDFHLCTLFRPAGEVRQCGPRRIDHINYIRYSSAITACFCSGVYRAGSLLFAMAATYELTVMTETLGYFLNTLSIWLLVLAYDRIQKNNLPALPTFSNTRHGFDLSQWCNAGTLQFNPTGQSTSFTRASAGCGVGTLPEIELVLATKCPHYSFLSHGRRDHGRSVDSSTILRIRHHLHFGQRRRSTVRRDYPNTGYVAGEASAISRKTKLSLSALNFLNPVFARICMNTSGGISSTRRHRY